MDMGKGMVTHFDRSDYSLETTLADHNTTDIGVKYQTFKPQPRGPPQ